MANPIDSSSSTAGDDAVNVAQYIDGAPPPDNDFSAIAGLEDRKRRLRESVLEPALTERHDCLGASGILIHGPTGAGKTQLIRALVGELGITQYRISPSDLPLESPDKTARIIEHLPPFVREHAPCVVVFDDFDIIASDDNGDAYGRPSQIGAALKSALDTIDAADKQVIAIAEATRLGDIESTVRRSGRIDIVMHLEEPDETRRRQLFKTEFEAITEQIDALELEDSKIDLDDCVELTSGFVAADIVAAVERAAQIAIADSTADRATLTRRALRASFEEIARRKADSESVSGHSVSTSNDPSEPSRDHGDATEAGGVDSDDGSGGTQQPDAGPETSSSHSHTPGLSDLSSDSEQDALDLPIGNLSVPDVTYHDIGGLDRVKRRLIESIQWPQQYPEQFDALDIEQPSGILLYGPPGTGKTMLAKAAANESDCRFISINGPEIFDKHFGESERFVRDLFDAAREVSPALIFFDEFDSIAARRGGYSAGNNLTDSIVNQLLSELDGMQGLEDVIVIAATNRVDTIDPALRRPGRFDVQIEVGAPDETARKEIFQVYLSDRNVTDDIDPSWLAKVTDDRYTGADIAAVCEQAAMSALRDNIDPGEAMERASSDAETALSETDEPVITRRDIEEALEQVTPSGAGVRTDDSVPRAFR